MNARFIVNARSGKAAAAIPEVERFARRHGAEVVFTERAAHAAELARAAAGAGCELVAAVGGDGTMNEVAGALVGTPAVLGLIPCGSGDGLGRHLGVHGSVRRALSILETGAPRLIDSGTAAGFPFFTAAGLGFEAIVAERFNQTAHRGLAGYLRIAAAAWRRRPAQPFVVDGQPLRAFTLAVANANQYGNNARIAPEASLDDGMLNLTVIPPIGAMTAAILAWRLFRGTLARSQAVTFRTGRRFEVQQPAPAPLHTDGETHPAGTSVVFEVRPRSLRVMAPAR